MSDGSKAHARRARPFADSALDVLLERTAELSRRWAIALVLDRPLERLGDVPLAQLALEAPALCGQLLRALASEHELALLLGDESGRTGRDAALAGRVGELVGAPDAGTVIAAVEALRGVLWEALLAELDPATVSHVRRVTDASDRLAYVCSALLPVALAALTAADDSEPAAESLPPATDLHVRGSSLRARTASVPGARIVIVDERRKGEQPDASRAPEGQPIGSPEPAHMHEIEVRDERREEGPAAWIGSIGHQLERFEEDRLPFAVVLVEVSREQAGSSLLEAIEHALEGTLREAGGGSLTRERDGRYWLLANRTDRSGASDLAERLSAAAANAAAAAGTTIMVSIGTAVCPQDGMQPSALAAHADIGLYAARSRSRAGGLAESPSEDC